MAEMKEPETFTFPPMKRSESQPVERLFNYLRKLMSERFFGRVTIAFQAGHVCDLKVEQTKKLEDLGG
jgi:hypothetical protein